MNQSKTLEIVYTKKLALPFLSQLLYLIQYILLYFKQINTIYLSDQDRFMTRQTIRLCNRRFARVVNRSWQIGHLLRRFELPITLHLNKNELFNLNTNQHYQNMLWTLFFVHSFSKTSTKLLQNYFGDLFTDNLISLSRTRK